MARNLGQAGGTVNRKSHFVMRHSGRRSCGELVIPAASPAGEHVIPAAGSVGEHVIPAAAPAATGRNPISGKQNTPDASG